jgi:hypothetical protein
MCIGDVDSGAVIACPFCSSGVEGGEEIEWTIGRGRFSRWVVGLLDGVNGGMEVTYKRLEDSPYDEERRVSKGSKEAM